MGPENNVGLGGCNIGLWSASYHNIIHMVAVPHIMVGLKRMLDYRGARFVRFHCTIIIDHYITDNSKFTKQRDH